MITINQANTHPSQEVLLKHEGRPFCLSTTELKRLRTTPYHAFSHFCSPLRPRLQIRISGPQVSNLWLSPFRPQQTIAMKTLSNHLMLSMVPLALVLASSPAASLKYPDKSKRRRKGVFGRQFKAVYHGRSPGGRSLCWSWSQPASQRAAGMNACRCSALFPTLYNLIQDMLGVGVGSSANS